MPWCPVCKNEYKEGYTLCADCGAELVDELVEDIVNDSQDNGSADDFFSESEPSLSEDILMELVDNIEDTEGEALGNFIAAAKNKKAEPFVKASQRAENYRSSAYALLIVGVLGLAFLVLSYFRIINIALAPNINALFYIVMGIMFFAFVIMGVKTFSAAKVIDSSAKDEDELTDRIYEFFASMDSETIDSKAFEGGESYLSDEEKFFPRSQVIKSTIIENFGELDDSFMTELVETVYSKIFE